MNGPATPGAESDLEPSGGLRAVLARAEESLGGDAAPSARLDMYREFLRHEEQRLGELARAGAPGLELAHRRAQLITVALERLWENAHGEEAGDGLVLGAVGGFGRGEMSPASDIDLVFIREGATDRTAEEVVKQILYVLWDLGLKVGHACRTVAETIDRAEAEPLIKTALLDARRLGGSVLLWQKFLEEFQRRSLAKGVDGYLAWRLENQASRHRKEGGTVFVQEPNLKTGVGGLRDFHNLRWVGRVAGEGISPAELVHRGWLGSAEAAQAEAAFAFLMSLREQLHHLQCGPGDVLTLRLQGELAEGMGYPQPNILRKSEALMRETYGHLRAVHLVCNAAATRICQQKTGRPRGLWSFFSGWTGARRAVDGFVLQGAELGAESPAVFREDPIRLIRVFRILQDQGSVPGAELAALIRANFSLLTEDWARCPEVRETFLHILRQKGKVGRILRWMHEGGFWGEFCRNSRPLPASCNMNSSTVIPPTSTPWSAWSSLMQCSDPRSPTCGNTAISTPAWKCRKFWPWRCCFTTPAKRNWPGTTRRSGRSTPPKWPGASSSAGGNWP